MIRPDLVSCLMVTQASRWRDGMPIGLRSYIEQSHQHRELIMVTADPCDEMISIVGDVVAGALHIMPAGSTLGQLRQAAVEECGGAFVATWDDDDVSRPGRISAQLALLQALPLADASGLSRVTIQDVIACRFFTSPVHAWEMTMLARRESMPAYRPDLRVGEDTDVLMRFRQFVLLDRPDLYIHVVHEGATVAPKLAQSWWENRTEGGAL